MSRGKKSIRSELKGLIEAVRRQNLRLKEAGLVFGTWGNVSAIDRRRGIVAIKPSGVDYARLTAADIVLTDLEGRRVASRCRPSSDLPSHLALYRAFPEIGAVAHTHSTYATAFAQAGRALPCLGTTHADYFHGAIPVTDSLRPREIAADYELNTGLAIVKKLRELNIRPLACPAVFVAGHGPFVWGADAAAAVESAIVLEEVCRMAWLTCALAGGLRPIPQRLLDKHYFRKHGVYAYYGQPSRSIRHGQIHARH